MSKYDEKEPERRGNNGGRDSDPNVGRIPMTDARRRELLLAGGLNPDPAEPEKGKMGK